MAYLHLQVALGYWEQNLRKWKKRNIYVKNQYVFKYTSTKHENQEKFIPWYRPQTFEWPQCCIGTHHELRPGGSQEGYLQRILGIIGLLDGLSFDAALPIVDQKIEISRTYRSARSNRTRYTYWHSFTSIGLLDFFPRLLYIDSPELIPYKLYVRTSYCIVN